GHTQIRKGLAILSASSKSQTSDMVNNRSLLTEAICHGLDGQAADLVGKVSIESLYRNADQYLTMANQRPQYASFLDQGMTLRKCKPTISPQIMRKIAELFRHTDTIDLSPAYEPDAKPEDLEKQADFAILQKLAKASLVEPIGEEHMYYAAIKSKSCGLTPFGKYYRDLVINRQI
ncbi:MAG: caspase family protein, partial [Bacteroidota bacterium]